MSKVWQAKKGWTDTDTGQKLEAPPIDMPGALQARTLEGIQRRLPSNWILAVYGIPQGQTYLRRKLCWLLKTHGLQSIDRGGSVYLGPENKSMDNRLREIVERLREKTGFGDLVKIFVGDYDGLTAAMFVDTVTRNALADLADAEASLKELEKAIAGEVTLKNKDNVELNLVSTGYGRLGAAHNAIQEVDSVLARFNGTKELEAEGDRIRTRLAQVRAWVATVQKGYDRFAKVERARQKKAADTTADGRQGKVA